MGLTLFMCLTLAAGSFALVSYLQTSLSATDVYEARVQRSAAVEAALQLGVDALHDGAARCLPSMEVPGTNGANVSVSCQNAGSATPSWSRHRITVTVTLAGGTTSGSALVQIPTWSPGVPCTQSCSLVVNSWSIGA